MNERWRASLHESFHNVASTILLERPGISVVTPSHAMTYFLIEYKLRGDKNEIVVFAGACLVDIIGDYIPTPKVVEVADVLQQEAVEQAMTADKYESLLTYSIDDELLAKKWLAAYGDGNPGFEYAGIILLANQFFVEHYDLIISIATRLYSRSVCNLSGLTQKFLEIEE